MMGWTGANGFERGAFDALPVSMFLGTRLDFISSFT